MSKLWSIFLIIGLVIVVGCQKDDETTEASVEALLIVPGQSVAGIHLGDSSEKVIERFGEIPASFFEAGNVYTYFLLYLNDGITFVFEPSPSDTFNATDKVSSIQMDEAFQGKTASGIGIGSSRDEVISTFGQPDSRVNDEDNYAIGINFEYGTQNRVNAITVK